MDISESASISQEFVYYPLTLFDGMSGIAGIAIGWLVEGLLDVNKLQETLNRVVAKWPMLAGRLESTGEKYQFKVKIPLGPLPSDYRPFVLTSQVSNAPISAYVKLPLPLISDAPPSHLFVDRAAPRSPEAWVTESLPLTYWHITHFKEPGHEYTCIGVVFSHALLDGTGIARLVHAVEAETLDQGWTPPPMPVIGTNTNQMQTFLDKIEKEMGESQNNDQLLSDYRTVSIIGLTFLLYHMVWLLWQKFWHKARRQMVLVPPKVYETLVRDARQAISQEGKDDVRLSTGDVLTAWLWKTIYSDGTHPKSKINLSYMTSLRRFSDAGLGDYVHNCFIPSPYPRSTVAELEATPLHSLAYILAKSRASLSYAHPMQVYKLLQEIVKPGSKDYHKSMILLDTTADENLIITNMSIARIVDIDWRGLGGGRTVCRYKSAVGTSWISFSNAVTIAGRIDDGSTVLDVVLNARRMKCLEEELMKLIVAD